MTLSSPQTGKIKFTTRMPLILALKQAFGAFSLPLNQAKLSLSCLQSLNPSPASWLLVQPFGGESWTPQYNEELDDYTCISRFKWAGEVGMFIPCPMLTV